MLAMLDESASEKLESVDTAEIAVDCLSDDVMGKAELLKISSVELGLSLVGREKGNSDLGRVTVRETEDKPKASLLVAVGEML